MALVQVRLIPLYRRAPFGVGYWSFTFSYAAPATLALRWVSHEHPADGPVWTWVVLALITGFIAAIAARTAVALVRGQFLPAAPDAAALTGPQPRSSSRAAWPGSRCSAPDRKVTRARRPAAPGTCPRS